MSAPQESVAGCVQMCFRPDGHPCSLHRRAVPRKAGRGAHGEGRGCVAGTPSGAGSGYCQVQGSVGLRRKGVREGRERKETGSTGTSTEHLFYPSVCAAVAVVETPVE